MIEPTLNYVLCPGAASAAGPFSGALASPPAQHRMAYWEWNGTGNPDHPHVVLCVHGLTRQGRDFDTLARALSRHARVICPDVVGRGQSDWLADPAGYQVPQYAADMLALLGQLQQQAPVQKLDWVGTSGGDTNLADNLDLSSAVLTSGLGWNTSNFHSNGTISVMAVPEPSRMVLVCMGLSGLLLRRRSRSRAQV